MLVNSRLVNTAGLVAKPLCQVRSTVVGMA